MKESLLYEEIAREIGDLVRAGTLRVGDRVPSVRTLARQKQVSVSTALLAYRTLEDAGVLRARPQSGFFVESRLGGAREPGESRPPDGPQPVGSSRLIARIFDAGAAWDDVVPLGGACPSPDLFPLAALRQGLATELRRRPELPGRYPLTHGNPRFLRELARHALSRGVAVHPDDIIATNGCQDALFLALGALTRPGDIVAVPSPTYFGLLQILERLGLRALEIPTHPRTGISLEALDVGLQTTEIAACVATAVVGNPLGELVDDDRKRALVTLLSERGVPLVEDDVYGDLAPSEASARPLKGFDTAGDVLWCGSFSKVLAPGMRLGWIVPGRHRAAVAALKQTTSISTSELPQAALAGYLSGSSYDRHLRKLRRRLAGQLSRVRDAVLERFPAGTRVTHPAAGFLLWVELPVGVDSLRLHEDALAAGISVVPGPLFSASRRYTNYLRLSCGVPWDARIDRAITTLAGLSAAQLEGGPGPTGGDGRAAQKV